MASPIFIYNYKEELSYINKNKLVNGKYFIHFMRGKLLTIKFNCKLHHTIF